MPDADLRPAPPVTPDADATAYDPKQVEAGWYAFWDAHGFFRADADSDAPPHVIVMPPPNVTGRLHMGHALQDAVQDALTRIRRMQGYNALWLPGMDHAGIATQNVVERRLREQGIERKEIGREAFIEHVWTYVEEFGGIIFQQKRRLGDSCDWSRERFTLDEEYNRVVQDIFVRLYDEGLIYRGNYLVNWDPDNMTALSDEEVDNVERDGQMWWIRYPYSDGSGHVTIATTRPETMLGDTAIAVHPDDERYTDLIGKTVTLPLLGREIPIVADEHADPAFGAGALKVTPAHDKNDFEIGKRHGLEVLTIMNPDATINEHGGPYEGLDRFEARKRIVADLDAQGLLDRVEPYKNTVPISSRSKAVIEPLISRQWFVKMKPLADPALAAVRAGEVTFYPERWQNEYFRWLENIRDWTISRQLWWGHRIPVWYYTDEHGERDESRDFVVSVEQPEPGMVQDEDVLDTWFSSWLWPFATLGWPDETADLKAFYPGTVLVSGYDILFFWIARMIMAGIHFTGEVPYRDVYITGMIKDAQGRWMSKSLGNGIDPLEMADEYGADAVRFSLNVLCTPGQDIKLEPSKFEMGRNFANKIWNAFNVFGRFMEPGPEGRLRDYRRSRSFDELELVERWILTRLNETIKTVDEAVGRYRLNEAALAIYDLFWRDYCDWFLELIKPPFGEAMDEDKIALAVEVYEQMVKLLHPFMPFITEEMWHRLRPRAEGDACIVAAWPTWKDSEVTMDKKDFRLRERGSAAIQSFSLIQEITTSIRSIRSSYNVPPSRGISVVLSIPSEEWNVVDPIGNPDSLERMLENHASYFEQLARVDDLDVVREGQKPKASATAVIPLRTATASIEMFVPLAGMIDLDEERTRLRKAIDEKEAFFVGVERKLQNRQFVTRAPEDVVARERQKAADAKAELQKLRANLEDLG